MLPPPGQHRHVAYLREMPGEEASDDSGADNADPFDHARGAA